MKLSIFVSYARTDSAIVRPLAGLLAAALDPGGDAKWPSRELVFLDTDQLRPGYNWSKQINEALARSSKVFAFWCEHAVASSEVAREIGYALSLGKLVVPVLLDDAPLSQHLANVHAVDLRYLRAHVVGPPPYPRNQKLQAQASVYASRLADAFAFALEVDAVALAARIDRLIVPNIV